MTDTLDVLMPTVRIVNETGLPNDTKVFGPDGSEIAGITRISACEITPMSGAVRAELTVCLHGLDINAHAFLSLKSLTEAAAMRGMKLVPGDG